MRRMVSFVLGGGKGTRLFPLTHYRSKPAVPLAGKYRIIDIPISNCINSGVTRIYLLTQFNSVSLHRHIRQTYRFDRFAGGFVEILAAQQTNEETDWYQGTADAVRKQIRYVEQPGIDHVLILSGDQIYRMNYADMLATHQRTGADVTIATVPVDSKAAAAFGIMRINETGKVEGFLEKPKTEAELSIVRTDPSWMESQGIKANGRDCLASMGIYLFNRDTLVELLSGSDYQDFGREVFPMAIRARKVYAHVFDGYWEDIGTIKSFYEANLALAGANPPFEFAQEGAPIYTHARSLPSTRFSNVTVRSSLIADGCDIGEGTVIENSVIGVRCRIGRNVTIRNTVVMGADNYQTESFDDPKNPPLGIGDGSFINGAIVDKNCRIGRSVHLRKLTSAPDDVDLNDDVLIRYGIICVQRAAVIPDGWSV